MNRDEQAAERIQRFLAPRYALNRGKVDWQAVGEADTPGEDARCRIGLVSDTRTSHITDIGFRVFGPSVTIACADWLCERLMKRTLTEARKITINDFQEPLALMPSERYAAILVLDALANALCNLRS